MAESRNGGHVSRLIGLLGLCCVEFPKALNYATYLAVRLFICLVQAVRLETCERLADLLATIATDVIPLRRKLIDENLRHAFPELDQRR